MNTTPIPWKSVAHGWDEVGIYTDDFKERIASVEINGDCTEDTQDLFEKVMNANAALIVRAVNNHQKLINALIEFDDCYCDVGPNGELNHEQRIKHRNMLMNVRALIKSAKEEV